MLRKKIGRSIKTRIMLSFSGAIVLTLCLVLLAFNILVDSFVRQLAETQLNSALQTVLGSQTNDRRGLDGRDLSHAVPGSREQVDDEIGRAHV